MSTDIIPTVQQQDIDDSLVELFELNLEGLSNQPLYLAAGMDEGTDNIYFPTEDGTALKEYIAIPITMGNSSLTSDGPQDRPSLTIANLVSLGRTITNNSDGTNDEESFDSILQDNSVTKPEDLVGTSIIYRRTFLKNTYRQSDVSGWSTTLPKEFPKAKYLLDRVVSETSTIVSYELTSPFDVETVKIPGRIIIGKYCPWEYQGFDLNGGVSSGCTWPCTSDQTHFYDIDNTLINTSNVSVYNANSAYSVGDLVSTTTTHTRKDNTTVSRYQIWKCIVAKPSSVAANPNYNSVYWERHDVCGKTLASCKKRFQGPDEVREILLPFGGFPGTKKFK